MTVDASHHDPAVLLRAEHAVGRVLTDACDEATAFPRLLAAVGVLDPEVVADRQQLLAHQKPLASWLVAAMSQESHRLHRTPASQPSITQTG